MEIAILMLCLLALGVALVVIAGKLSVLRTMAERRAAEAAQHIQGLQLRAHAAEQAAHQAHQRAQYAEGRAAAVDQRIAVLAKYQHIVDVQAAVNALRSTAEREAQAKRDELGRALAAGQTQVAAQVAEVGRLEAVVRALKNRAHGYGDEYILPATGLLDELADSFAHSDAGVKLKAARAHTKALIASGAAASSKYVETERRTTAERFVIDAFNGKVDSLLADVKGDNFGKLAAKIKDAFALVNANGQAFRDTRITDVYLAARLDELKWAVVANELKVQEREEQRALREKMRDEERAQKEIERAQKEAEKEETAIRKALEKARQDAAASSEADRARYEGKLAELVEKLRVAEEKGQRAKSMAEQTKAGNVYVISNIGSFGEHVYKIGMTRRLEPQDRVDELGDASVPFEFDVHAFIRSDDAPALETALHRLFASSQMNKVNPRKEFFRLRLEDIRAEVEKLGFETGWTMLAKAQEYRESVQIAQTAAESRVKVAA